MPSGTNGRLPWENTQDISLHTNEYVQISTLNRPLKRLLENIKWLLRFSFLLTPDKIKDSSDVPVVQGSGKYMKLDVTDTGDVYYIPLYEKQ